MKRIYVKDQLPPDNECVLCVQRLDDGSGKMHYRYIVAYHIDEEGFWDVLNEEGIENVIWYYELPEIEENNNL